MVETSPLSEPTMSTMADQQNDIQHTVHHLDRNVGDLDRRVSILEERSKAQAEATTKLHDNMGQLHEDVRKNNKMVTDLSSKIDSHREEDRKTQNRTFRWIITTLVSVIIGIAFLALENTLMS